MKLSTTAWEKSARVYQAILQHPFIQELAAGTLSPDKFAYYIEQDSLYLQDFARCHAIVASKIALPQVRTFLRYAEECFIAEQEVVHQFFKETFHFTATGLLTPATLSYTSYLLRVCVMEPVEVAIAALLPCFWVYRQVGLWITHHTESANPYAHWIETYAGESFGVAVDNMIDIFDRAAANTTTAIQEKMLDAFYKSTCLEWHFWHDTYYKHVLDKMAHNAMTINA